MGLECFQQRNSTTSLGSLFQSSVVLKVLIDYDQKHLQKEAIVVLKLSGLLYLRETSIHDKGLRSD